MTNEQRDLIGQKDNNAPPILKIYWDNGKIRIKTKVLKDLNATDEELLHEDAWDNDAGFNFEQKVDFNAFTLEVKVSKGKMVIILNGTEYKVYREFTWSDGEYLKIILKQETIFNQGTKAPFLKCVFIN